MTVYCINMSIDRSTTEIYHSNIKSGQLLVRCRPLQYQLHLHGKLLCD